MSMKSPKIAKNDVFVPVARNEESPCFVSVATSKKKISVEVHVHLFERLFLTTS